MLFEEGHLMYVGIPETFPEKSLCTKAMTCLAMGVTKWQFMDLCDDSIEEKQTRLLVMEIAKEVKAKMYSLKM